MKDVVIVETRRKVQGATVAADDLSLAMTPGTICGMVSRLTARRAVRPQP